MNLFSKAFWARAVELTLVAFAGTFAGSLKFTNGAPTWSGVISAAIAGGIAALYALVTQLKTVQTVNSIMASAKHAPMDTHKI